VSASYVRSKPVRFATGTTSRRSGSRATGDPDGPGRDGEAAFAEAAAEVAEVGAGRVEAAVAVSGEADVAGDPHPATVIETAIAIHAIPMGAYRRRR